MVRNILAVIVGVAIGSVVNMGLVMLGSALISSPEGVNPGDMESLQKGMHLFGPQHFITPFLAHALGTLAGAFVASMIAVSHNFKIAVGIGIFFLLGGITAAAMLPAPLWFEALDIILAYIPMSLLGWKLSGKES